MCVINRPFFQDEYNTEQTSQIIDMLRDWFKSLIQWSNSLIVLFM